MDRVVASFSRNRWLQTIDKENWKHFLQIMLKCLKCCNWVIWNHQKLTKSHRAVLCIPGVLTSTSTISPRTAEYNSAIGYIGMNSTLKNNGKNCESFLINNFAWFSHWVCAFLICQLVCQQFGGPNKIVWCLATFFWAGVVVSTIR